MRCSQGAERNRQLRRGPIGSPRSVRPCSVTVREDVCALRPRSEAALALAHLRSFVAVPGASFLRDLRTSLLPPRCMDFM
jgi:hypothetical protein